MSATGAATKWSAATLVELRLSAYCPSSLSQSIAFGVLGNQPGQTEVGQISDQRQMHL